MLLLFDMNSEKVSCLVVTLGKRQYISIWTIQRSLLFDNSSLKNSLLDLYDKLMPFIFISIKASFSNTEYILWWSVVTDEEVQVVDNSCW